MAEPTKRNMTLQEQCDHANAQLILKGINDEPQRKALGPVKWVIRGGRVVLDWA